jgi:hypothetical protein
MYGIEKSHLQKKTTLSPCLRSYGVALDEEYSVRKYSSEDRYRDELTDKDMAQRQLTWLIRRGDLVLSDAKKEFEKEFKFHISESGDRKFDFPVFEYPDDDDDEPDQFEIGQHGTHPFQIINNSIANFIISRVEGSCIT